MMRSFNSTVGSTYEFQIIFDQWTFFNLITLSWIIKEHWQNCILPTNVWPQMFDDMHLQQAYSTSSFIRTWALAMRQRQWTSLRLRVVLDLSGVVHQLNSLFSSFPPNNNLLITASANVDMPSCTHQTEPSQKLFWEIISEFSMKPAYSRSCSKLAFPKSFLPVSRTNNERLRSFFNASCAEQ